MYHDIRDDTKYKSRMALKSFLNINQFKKQLSYITSNYTPIGTRDLIHHIYKKGKFAILTFDDGLRDHYNVCSILLDRKIKGTFLIPTLPIKNREVMTAHKIQFILSSMPEISAVLEIMKLLKASPVEEDTLWKHYSVSKWESNWWTKEMVFITNFLRMPFNKWIVDRMFSRFLTKDEKAFAEDLYLSEKQLKEMADAGMEIGAHGYTSKSLESVEDQEEEISKSLEYVKQFDDKGLIFSYPQGSYNDQTLGLLKKYNCKYAYTTKPDFITGNIHALEIPRFNGPQTIPL